MPNRSVLVSSPTFPYELRRKAGEGAMGVVYEAFDHDLGRPVAIKVMRDDLLAELGPEGQKEARLRFQQEARAAARLSHAGIATIHRIGEENGRPFIAMEWLDGEPLESLLASGAPLPLGLVARLGVELGEALEAAHAAGVVHRDIKPSNLILRADGRLKVTGFGIARIEGIELVKTRAGEVVATPMYASPEQLRGLPVDGRSDIFGAGVVLYQCLTGRPPSSGATLAELTTSILFGRPEAPTSLNRDLPAAVDGIVLKALEKDPARRFSHASELAEALRPFAAAVRPNPRPASPAASSVGPFVLSPFGSSPAGATVVSTEGRIVLDGLPSGASRVAEAAVNAWPARSLPKGPVSSLLARLTETPLHAEPFAGAVKVAGRYLLLVCDGWVVGAFDTVSGEEGDGVVEALPAEAQAELHAVPAGIPPGIVRLLASLLKPRKARFEGLDSSFVNLPALARRLRDEAFSGVVRLNRDGDEAFILLHEGRSALSLFSGPWDGAPVSEPWETWVSDVLLHATVEEASAEPVFASFRLQLADAAVEVPPEASPEASRSPGRGLFRTSRRTGFDTRAAGAAALRLELAGTDPTRTGGASDEARQRAFAADGAARFLSWLVGKAPAVLQRIGKEKSLKYLADWIPLVKRARIHHALPRPKSRETDLFDVVTFGEDDKVLHLAHRVARVTPEVLAHFVERVTAAKEARTRTGDVGAAILVSPFFDESVAEAYREVTSREAEKSRSWTFGAIEAATNYEGFVRIGPRRGFHLVLVEEGPSGFEVVLP